MTFNLIKYSADLTGKCVTKTSSGMKKMGNGIDLRLIMPCYRKMIFFLSKRYDNKVVKHSLMSEWKEKSLHDFRLWLSAMPEDKFAMVEDSGQDSCDLFSVLSEMASLRKDVIDQSATQMESIKALESFSEFCRSSAEFFKTRDKNLKEFQEDLRRNIQKETTLPFLDQRDILVKGLLAAEKAAEPRGLFRRVNQEMVEMVSCYKAALRNLDHALEVAGIKPVQTTGKPFNPRSMRAITHEESTEHLEGTVIREVSSGFIFAGRLLRTAEVVVSK